MTLAADRARPVRVLLAEDERLVRDALARIVSSDPMLEVVGAAVDAESAIDLARREQPDVAFVDVKMPGGGAYATREIRRCSPKTNLIALSAYEDRATVLEMVRAGVVGYMVKSSSNAEIIAAAHGAAKGQGTLSVEVTIDVIHELSALLAQTEHLAEELQELDRMKRDLIQVLSHEIFTPITTIQGFATLISQHNQDLSPRDLQELAVGVGRASRRLRRLVGNLRAAAQLDRESVVIDTRLVVPTELLQLATAEFDEDRLRVTDTVGVAGRVWADPELAAGAVAILVENALDFSPPGEEVEIWVSMGSGTATLTVADRGPGVAPEMEARIFAPFEQTQDVMTRNHEGLGIGLFLAARIMDAIGGGIDVQPRDGGGALFTLTFAAVDTRVPALDAPA